MGLITANMREQCRPYDVHVMDDAHVEFRRGQEMIVEAPAEIRAGTFDVDVIGAFSYMGGENTFIRHVAMIGRFTSIAASVVIGPPDHPLDFLSPHPMFFGKLKWQALAEFRERNSTSIARAIQVYGQTVDKRGTRVAIGNDVWIGEGAFIRRGVTIGDGAVIGARSVVTRDVPPYAVVAGTPARIIRYRFEPDVIATLLELQWWHYGISALEGVDFTNIDLAIWRINDNIASGRAQPYRAPVLGIVDETVTAYDFDPASALDEDESLSAAASQRSAHP